MTTLKYDAFASEVPKMQLDLAEVSDRSISQVKLSLEGDESARRSLHLASQTLKTFARIDVRLEGRLANTERYEHPVPVGL